MNTWTKGMVLMGPITLAVLGGCGPDSAMTHEVSDGSVAELANEVAQLQYGASIGIGNGQARTYVLMSPDGQSPLELGVSIDAAGLEGLPSDMRMNRMALPSQAPAPFTFAMVDWNPVGHEPPGIYDLPHFDFHFYVVPETEVDQIVPTRPSFAAEANHLPTGEVVPEHMIVLTEPGADPAAAAVPQMGVHWLDVRSPELQAILGNQEGFAAFTKTFLYGSWNGEFTFYEPMITRDYLLSRPDEIIPISKPAAYAAPGWYPGAYRIAFDAQAGEYRIALTEFSWHD